MKALRRMLPVALTLVVLVATQAVALDASLLPKYGSVAKSALQRQADERFIAAVDQQYKGDRKKASKDTAMRGWNLLRQGNAKDAMRRFNQAWLLDNANGLALWGMAAIQADIGKAADALMLFQEAEAQLGEDLDFSVDHAKAMGIAGAETGNNALLEEAFSKFARLYAKAPQNVLNLQNWAITLFYIGDYAEAWKKIQLAEALPRHDDIDQNFIADLQKKMPRP